MKLTTLNLNFCFFWVFWTAGEKISLFLILNADFKYNFYLALVLASAGASKDLIILNSSLKGQSGENELVF